MKKCTIQSIPWETHTHAPTFEVKRKRLSREAGGKELGCSYYELEPGKRAFPLHFHHNNEESMFIINGTGELTTGDEVLPIAAGDYITFLAGPDGAHECHNTGSEPLIFLCLSTMHEPDICEYPRTKKLIVWEAKEKYFLHNENGSYWDGE